MEMEPSEVQEAEKVEENEQKVVKINLRETMKAEESKEKPNAACVSALDMILKSLTKTTIFSCDLLIVACKETHHKFVQEYLAQLDDLFLRELSLINRPMEENGVSEILVTVLELLPRWNRHLEVYELVKKSCNRCKMDTEYPPVRSYGIIINANVLSETKSAFMDFAFESILKVIKINLKMHCKTEGCEKRNYVDRMISKLPSVFTIALEWENNETREQISSTTSILATEIDISAVYQYEDNCPYTKYRLVSMVCSHGDHYNCLAYEDNRWVRYFYSERQVIGDWGSVLNTFVKLNMRPEILFFENVMQRKQIVNAQINTENALINMLKNNGTRVICFGG